MAKPCPSSPMRRSSGIRTPSRWICAVGALQAHLLLRRCRGQALGVAGHQERGDAPRPVRPGARHDRVEVGDAAVGDPRLGAREHPVVAVADRLGAQGGGVRAGRGFGQGVGAEPVAAEHGGQMLGPLLLGAVGGERVGGQGVHAQAQADGQAGRGQFLQDLQIDLVRLVPAAVLRVVGQAEQARAGQEAEHLTGETAGVLLLGRLRGDLVPGDVTHERDQLPGLVRGQLPVHRLRGAVGHGDALLPVGHSGGRTPWVGGSAGGFLGAGRCSRFPGRGSG